MKRREFFNSFFNTKDKNIIRPPYFKDENDFEKCKFCDKICASVCEEKIIFIDENKPALNFKNSGCTYCDLCATACKKDVLKYEYKKNINFSFQINTKNCLSWQNIVCFSCKDVCLDNAIIFSNMFRPHINENCTNCGFCVSRCVGENAINIKRTS